MRDAVEEHLFWCIGDGNCSFWYDPWLQDDLIPLEGINKDENLKVNELWTDGKWDINKLTALVSEDYAEQIITIPILQDSKDKLIWKATANGDFSFKSAYELLRNHRQQSPVFKAFWHNSIPKKMSMTAWRLHQKLIPVDEVLQRQGLIIASKCVCCNQIETLSHVFFTNTEAAKVWTNIANIFGISNSPVTSLQNALTTWSFSVSQAGHIRKIVPIVIIWCLWEARNLKKHENAPYSSYKITNRICSFLLLFGQSSLLNFRHWKGDFNAASYFNARVILPPKLPPLVVKWEKPAKGFLKLNIDGSFGLENSSCGSVLRDHEGNLIVAFSRCFLAFSPTEAEIKAIFYSLSWCEEHHLENILVEVDSQQAISNIKNRKGHWQSYSYIGKISQLLNNLHATISHTFRESNRAADYMAKKAGREGSNLTWNSNEASRELKAIIRLEQLELPYLRKR